MSDAQLPDDEDGVVFEPEPEREAIYVVTIHVRGEHDPIHTTIPVAAPDGDHDLVIAEAVADIVAATLGAPPAELVGLGQPSKPGLRGPRGMGWVLGRETRPNGGIPEMVEAATAWWAAEALDLTWLVDEYLPSQW